MKKYLLALFLMFIGFFSLFSQAEMVDTFAFKDQAEQERATELARSLRCPQCQNQNLVESNSPIAYDLRIEVYKMVDEGKSNQEIIDLMTSRFGDFVNYKPPFQWNTLLLWLSPITLFLIALGLLWRSRQQIKNQVALPEKSTESTTHFNDSMVIKDEVKTDKKILCLLLTLLMVISLAYYFSLDRFKLVQQGEQTNTAKIAETMTTTDKHKNENQIEKIQHKLRESPNDAELWIQLGEMYTQNNEFEYALIAYGNAEKISGAKPTILGLAATALYYQSGKQITSQVDKLLEMALSQDPKEISSLSLIAAAAFDQKNYAKALDYWQQMLDSGNSAVDRRAVVQRMKMVEFLMKGK